MRVGGARVKRSAERIPNSIAAIFAAAHNLIDRTRPADAQDDALFVCAPFERLRLQAAIGV